MRVYILMWCAVAALGCGGGDPINFKSQCDKPAPGAQSCMIECARAANPHSDEEGEDLVRECARQCYRMNCERTTWLYWTQAGFLGAKSGYQRCALASKRIQMLCRAAGWNGPD